MIKKQYLLFMLSLTSASIYSIAPTNLFMPYDSLLIPETWPGSRFQFSIDYEGSYKVHGFQEEDIINTGKKRKVNTLQLWQCTQDALAMIKGFNSEDPLGQLSQSFNIDDDNGSHGLYVATGNFEIPINLIFSARWFLAHNFSVVLFLPYYKMTLKNVCLTEQTNHTSFESNLDQNFIPTLQNKGCVSLSNWERHGVGDLVAQAMWRQNFPQYRPFLKNVRLNVRFGATFPTGVKEDTNKILAIPFGNDGAWGFVFGTGLDLNISSFLRFGLDANFLYLFGNTRTRRIKTDLAQTDLFLLNQYRAYKHYGLTNWFTLYGELFRITHGLSAKVAYEFIHHDDDTVYVESDMVNPLIANSAVSLMDWTTHSFIFSLSYDPYCDFPQSRFKPYITAFAKWGFNGRNAILADTLGVTFSLSF